MVFSSFLVLYTVSACQVFSIKVFLSLLVLVHKWSASSDLCSRTFSSSHSIYVNCVSGNAPIGVSTSLTGTGEAWSFLLRLSLVQDPGGPAPDPTRTRGFS